MTTQQTTTESTYTPPDVELPEGYEWAGEYRPPKLGEEFAFGGGVYFHRAGSVASGEDGLAIINECMQVDAYPQHIVRRTLPTDAEAIARIEREPLPERLSVDLSQPLTHVDRLRVVAAVYRDDEWLADTLLDIADDIEWEKNRPLLTPTGATHADTRERE